MAAATLTEKGQVVIPASIRARYGLTPGTQVEFVDDGGTIRLVVRRRLAKSDPQAGFGMMSLKLFMILLILAYTSPTAAHSLARAALHGGLDPEAGGGERPSTS